MASSPDEFLDARSNFTPNNDINNTRGTPDSENQTPPTGRRTLFATSTQRTNNNSSEESNIHNDVSVVDVISPGTPRYLQQELPHLQPFDLEIVREESLEYGDGDSAASASELEDIDSTYEATRTERLEVEIKLEDDGENAIKDGDGNYIPYSVDGLDENTSLPRVPEDWVAPPPKKDEPKFEDVDNPGEWHEFTYRPRFYKPKKGNKTKKGFKVGQYLGHFLPTGATVVEADEDGKRKVGEWEFHYNDWTLDVESQYRSGSTKANPFPQERSGKLNYELLKKLGLNRKRIKNRDALFFFQLLFPI